MAPGVSDMADLTYRTPGTRRTTRARCWGRAGEELPRRLLQKPGDNRKCSKSQRESAHGRNLYPKGEVHPARGEPGPPWAFPLTPGPPKAPTGTTPPRPCVLTLDEKEKTHDAHGGHDGPGDDEGQAPARGHPVASDQGSQDVAHGGVRIPDPHNQTPPATQRNTNDPEKSLCASRCRTDDAQDVLGAPRK